MPKIDANQNEAVVRDYDNYSLFFMITRNKLGNRDRVNRRICIRQASEDHYNSTAEFFNGDSEDLPTQIKSTSYE